MLGQAGLIDDRPVTTHWAYTDDLARQFPRARILPGQLYVDDGDLLTSAGLAAGLATGRSWKRKRRSLLASVSDAAVTDGLGPLPGRFTRGTRATIAGSCCYS